MKATVNDLTDDVIQKLLFETEDVAQQILDEEFPDSFTVTVHDTRGTTSIEDRRGAVIYIHS